MGSISNRFTEFAERMFQRLASSARHSLATQDGELTLVWNLEPGTGSTGRGTQVAEVWLVKKPSE